ncbi:hypothetical protein FL583_09800 [Cryptosporangium phraense]|uniref:DUF8175 domain-containing protein n=1 Tax=Cryptosporangium phraense TaxID=2593070 RepID=A0A545AVK2_9ACTN|nr:hypothetical protein FL583_09800 [Cryptosporangium phraense]
MLGVLGVVAVVLVCVLGGATAALLVTRNSGSGPEYAFPSASPGDDGPTGPLPTATPTAAPSGVTWEVVHGDDVPTSKTDGPAHVDAQQVASGYSRTPTGALIATAQIGTRAGWVDQPEAAKKTVQTQMIPGEDRDLFLGNLRTHTRRLDVRKRAQIAGFRFVSYSPGQAVIELAYRSISADVASYMGLTLTVRWVAGDWRLVAPPGGSWNTLRQLNVDPGDFTRWGRS